jgi:hypothetical protein
MGPWDHIFAEKGPIMHHIIQGSRRGRPGTVEEIKERRVLSCVDGETDRQLDVSNGQMGNFSHGYIVQR